MSTVLLPGPPGKVIAMEDPGVQGVLPPLVDIEKGAVSFQQRKSIITRVMLSQETSQQFLHTLGGDIFIYVFGDRIGQMQISGVCVSQNCEKLSDTEHGVEKMLKFYNQYKLSRRREPVTILIGKTPIKAFIGGFTADTLQHELRMMQFNLSLWVPPEKE